MTTLATIDYDAGTNGAAMDTASGWNASTPTGTITYDNTFAVNGTLGCKCVGQGIARRNVTAGQEFRLCWYEQLPTAAPGANALIAQGRLGTTQQAGVRLEAAGSLRLINVLTATGSSSSVLGNGETVRLEWSLSGSGTTQTLEIYRGSLGNQHGTVPDETLTGTYTAGNIDNLTCGTFPVTVASFVTYSDRAIITDTPGTQIGGIAVNANPAAGAATGTGAAGDPAASIAVNAEAAAGTGAAPDPAVTPVAVNAEVASGTGDALFDPTGSTVSLELISDNPVLVVAVALDGVLALLVGSTTAAGTGTAGDPLIATSGQTAAEPAFAGGSAFDADSLLLAFGAELAAAAGAGLDASVDIPSVLFRFTSPTRTLTVRPFAEPGAPWGPRMQRVVGLTVYRLDGQWYAASATSAAVQEAADRFFLGGHIYTVDRAGADELTAAGYGAYLTPIAE